MRRIARPMACTDRPRQPGAKAAGGDPVLSASSLPDTTSGQGRQTVQRLARVVADAQAAPV